MPKKLKPHEVWKPVIGFEGLYEVSDCGRVRSLERFVGTGKKRRINFARILKPKSNSKYREVKLRKDGASHMRRVNNLVLNAFVGMRPSGLICRHIDGDSHNNIVANLSWGTYLQNAEDSMRLGTILHGENHSNATLTDRAVQFIRKSNKTGRQLAAKYNVSASTISAIRNNKRWRHI